MDRIIEIKQGDTVFITEGEYSDYSIDGFFIALQDINDDTLKEADDLFWKDVDAGLLKDYEGVLLSRDYPYISSQRKERFLYYLLKLNVLEEIEAKEIWLGAYGRLECVDD